MALPPAITLNGVTLTYSWAAANTYYGYCTVADVRFEFTNQTQYTTLTDSVIAQEITIAADELQKMLDTVYQMPYTGSDNGIKLTLGEINAKLAAANIMERYFQGAAPNASSWAAERRSYAELRILSVLKGEEQWAAPFGDAVPRSDKAIYPKSAVIVGYPDNATSPIFTLAGGLNYKKPNIG